MQRHNKIPLGGLQVWPKVPAPPMLRVATVSPLPPEDRARLLQRYGKEPQARRRAWRDAKVLARIVFAVLVVALLVGLLAGCSDLGGAAPVCVWGPVL